MVEIGECSRSPARISDARDVRGEPGRSQAATAGAQLQAEPRGRDDGTQRDAAHGIVAGKEGGLGVRLPAWSTATISIR